MAVGMVAPLEAVQQGRMPQQQQQQRRLRSLYWKLRAEIRRQVGCRGGARARRTSFHYDAFSYALNFDDGGSRFLC